jgi:hypothetical protein
MKPMNRNNVAQIVNLLYRRLATGRARTILEQTKFSGLPIRDTADCQSALPQEGAEK